VYCFVLCGWAGCVRATRACGCANTGCYAGNSNADYGCSTNLYAAADDHAHAFANADGLADTCSNGNNCAIANARATLADANCDGATAGADLPHAATRFSGNTYNYRHAAREHNDYSARNTLAAAIAHLHES